MVVCLQSARRAHLAHAFAQLAIKQAAVLGSSTRASRVGATTRQPTPRRAASPGGQSATAALVRHARRLPHATS